MKVSLAAIEAKEGKTLQAQWSNCLDQLENFLADKAYSFENVVALNLFLFARNPEEYEASCEAIKSLLLPELSGEIPIAFLAQPPASGNQVSVEVHYIEDLSDAKVHSRIAKGFKYRVISNHSGEKLVIANGIAPSETDLTIEEQAEQVFLTMERILDQEGLAFNQIYRQWNYIENITMVDSDKKSGNQHYQQFNNVRTKYYSKADFKSGYPAATGIGTLAGGVIVSFYAASTDAVRLLSVENPLQRAAFEYTDEVLIGSSEYNGFHHCTPKFSRAKLVENQKSVQIYISGTAAIRDENTVGLNDVEMQTEITVENIFQLISPDTILPLFPGAAKNIPIEFIRVYIKDKSYYQKVRKVCNRLLPGVSGIYVVSDVCRDNLLVEIEALAAF